MGKPFVTFKKDSTNGGFWPSKNICVIDLVEPMADAKHEYARLVMFLKKSTEDFFTIDEFKGELLIYSSSVFVPDACEVLVKQYPLNEAKAIIMGSQKIPANIEFEILNRRVSSSSIQAITENRVFRSASIFDLVSVLKGPYLFMTEPSDPEHNDDLLIGAAYIEENGHVQMWVSHYINTIKNYVENVASQGDSIIRINPLSETEGIKLSFYLKASYKSKRVTDLTGKVMGLNNGVIYGSNVVFMPAPDVDGIEKMDSLEDKMDYLIKQNESNINYFSPKDLNVGIRKELKEQWDKANKKESKEEMSS